MNVSNYRLNLGGNFNYPALGYNMYEGLAGVLLELFPYPEGGKDKIVHERHKIWQLVRDGKPRTLTEIAMLSGFSEDFVAAQLRFLKRTLRGFVLTKMDLGAGVCAYRVERIAREVPHGA